MSTSTKNRLQKPKNENNKRRLPRPTPTTYHRITETASLQLKRILQTNNHGKHYPELATLQGQCGGRPDEEKTKAGPKKENEQQRGHAEVAGGKEFKPDRTTPQGAGPRPPITEMAFLQLNHIFKPTAGSSINKESTIKSWPRCKARAVVSQKTNAEKTKNKQGTEGSAGRHPHPGPGPKDERVRKHRGRTNPKVTHIPINDGSDGVEADKARAGMGAAGTRADWERVKQNPNLTGTRDGHEVAGGRRKNCTGQHSSQGAGCRVQGAHTKPLNKIMNLNVWHAWWARRGIHFRSPGWEEQGGVGLHWQAIAKNIPPTKHTPTTRRQQRTPQHPAHSSLPPRHPTHEI